MSTDAYTLLGLTAIVGALAAALTYAILRFGTAAAETRRRLRGSSGEAALLSAALQDAVAKLRAQERETAARADASERLSGEIIEKPHRGPAGRRAEPRSADSETRPGAGCCTSRSRRPKMITDGCSARRPC